MAETIQDKKVFSLQEVNQSIQKTLAERYKSSFWVKAEMNKLNFYKHSGHCYPELVDKKDGKVLAQMKAILWKDDYIRTNNLFLDVLKEPLKDGIKILFLAKITYNPSYGLALQIIDIDPAFTLGDLEKEKALSIQLLKEQGVFYQNKNLPMPLLPKRIAIISVETSKGYADFLDVLDKNEFGYKFFHLLFPSLLQGEKAVQSIIRELQRIKKVASHFDVVAIIRGGGGDVGLSCYNHYELAKEIALFPLPVLTGIGHATNQTVVEMVSHLNAITPTKIAEHLIQKFHNFAVPVSNAQEKLVSNAKQILVEQKSKLNTEVKYFRSATESLILLNKNRVNEHGKAIQQQAIFLFRNQKAYLENEKLQLLKSVKQVMHNQRNLIESQEKNLRNLDPKNILKRGFSITRINGQALQNTKALIQGDTIETTLFEGKIFSTVNKTEYEQ